MERDGSLEKKKIYSGIHLHALHGLTYLADMEWKRSSIIR